MTVSVATTAPAMAPPGHRGIPPTGESRRPEGLRYILLVSASLALWAGISRRAAEHLKALGRRAAWALRCDNALGPHIGGLRRRGRSLAVSASTSDGNAGGNLLADRHRRHNWGRRHSKSKHSAVVDGEVIEPGRSRRPRLTVCARHFLLEPGGPGSVKVFLSKGPSSAYNAAERLD